MRLQLFQGLQFLHLPLGLIDVGAHCLHGLQGLLHRRVVGVLLRRPLQQLLVGGGDRRVEWSLGQVINGLKPKSRHLQ